MKFIIAPDKFKGSLTGSEFCDAVEEGIKRVLPKAIILKKPLADGGDGTLAVIKDYLKAEWIEVEVQDPLFRPIPSQYLFSETSKTAYIEMSEASGLKLLSIEELNCMNTSSFGTGELILNAIKKGAEKIILGIGGSATNDGGMGMGQALGIQFLDSANKPLKPIGKNLNNIQKINIEQLNELVHKTKFRVACDVTNPLYGNEGAANVFASQKGADDSEIFLLDQGLRNLGRIIKKQFNIDVQKTPGSGAAGGLGGGAIAFLNASLVSGIDFVKELANFDKDLENTDWIITGEGKLDDQTFFGKAITGVIQSARKKQIPVAALCGSVSLSESEIIKLGLDYCAAITKEGTPLDEAMLLVYNNLVMSASNFCSGLIKKKL